MKKLISLLLVVALVCGIVCAVPPAFAADTHTVKVEGIYHQAQARTMLKKVNNFRTNAVPAGTAEKDYAGTQAWAWNSTNTKKVTYKKTALAYDYELEQIAMQRAAEIAVYYGADHTRPDGSSWRKAHTRYNDANGYSIGENIFATLNSDSIGSVNEAFEWWLEADEDYLGQSHRRNMLGTDYPFTAVAFACFEQNEVYYWVALFRSACISSTATTVGTDTVLKDVSLNARFIQSISLTANPASHVLDIGESANILLSAELISTNHILSYEDTTTGKKVYEPTRLQVIPTLSSSDTGIVAVSGNRITAKRSGSAVITATAFGKSVKISARVLQTDLANAQITLDKYADTYIYTGEPIEPVITAVSLGGVSLSAADYTVTYADNTDIGTGSITITGKGNYMGVASKRFQIIDKADCEHHIVIDYPTEATCQEYAKKMGTHCDICGTVIVPQEEDVQAGYAPHKAITVPAKPATCTSPGFSEGRVCSVCGEILTEPENLGLAAHTPVKDSAQEPTCTQVGKTEGSHCSVCGEVLEAQEDIPALGHIFSGKKTQKATLSGNGYVYQACTREGCSYIQKLSTIYYPKAFTLSKTSVYYNGKVQKPKLVIKDASGKTLSTANYSYAIPNSKNVGKYKITVKLKGNYSGTKYLYYTIVPKNTSKFTLTAAKKGFKIKWNTQKVQTTGYQIQYSLYSNFKKAKTYTLKNNKYYTATIGKLSGGKKYYVRMRTYRQVKFEGKKLYLYSGWSAKTIKTKK